MCSEMNRRLTGDSGEKVGKTDSNQVYYGGQ